LDEEVKRISSGGTPAVRDIRISPSETTSAPAPPLVEEPDQGDVRVRLTA